MKLLFVSLFVLVVWSPVSLQSKPKCFDNAKEQIEQYFATKTPYRIVQNDDLSEIAFEGCEATRMWMLIRHGTRNPGAKFIQLMKTQYTKLRDRIVISNHSQLCEYDKDELRKWEPTLLEEEEKYLLMEGEDELLELAERMQKRFPNLLTEEYDNSTYRFKYTATQRAQASFKYFATGLFGRQNIQQIWVPEALHKDPILRFYKLCSKWRAEVDKNPDTMIEANKFSETKIVEKVLEKIRRKTGVYGLTVENVHFMYQMCAYESAASRRSLSPWCALFDKNSMKVFEYLQDIEYYWIDGHGHELTWRQACPAFNDMLNRLDPDSDEPPITAYFTHSGTMLKMLSFLGLYKDEQALTHDRFDGDRKWRTSKIDAFGSNLVFVHFNCENNSSYILTLHQERPVRIPGCDDDLCDLKTFKHLFRRGIEHCDFEAMCYFPKISATTVEPLSES